MDMTNRDVREITMSKYFNKKTAPYWVIAVLVVLIAIILAVQFKANSSNQTTTATVKTSNSSEKASSSTKKYVAGKDYKITYSNTNLISKEQINKALGANYLNDINSLMSTKKPSGLDMAKVEVYYNKDKNLLVERLFKNGYKGNQDSARVVYDISQGKIPDNGADTDSHYLDLPLVYTWEKLTK